MKRLLFTIILFNVLLIAAGQTTENKINQTDDNGLKQGVWQKSYPGGGLQYTGFFKNNIPVGEFKRYDREGNLIATMFYKENNPRVFTKLHYPNKQIQAEGYFVNKLKDSTWNFYSEAGLLVGTITFVMDKKHGTENRYYDNGVVFEKLEWDYGLQNGTSIRYYDNGNVMIRSNYVDGLLHGSYSSFSINSKPLYYGHYVNNRREGKWYIYDESGKVKTEINYTNGIADNQEELNKLEQEEIDLLEKNKGKFVDPLEKMYNNNPPL